MKLLLYYNNQNIHILRIAESLNMFHKPLETEEQK